jgi:23S rRNA pseudouridine1911/1915/1917 synthase
MTDRVVASEYVVADDDPRFRLDRFAFERLGMRSKKGAKKAIKAGDVLLNGEQVETSRFVTPGDRITLLRDREPPKAYERPVPIVHCDDHVAIVHKPPGLVVSGNRFRTLQQALPYNLPPSGARDALLIPRPVHRLDARTQGLVVVARSASALVHLSRSFEHRRVTKRYRALVQGRLEGEGVVTEPVDGREARSRYRAVTHTPSRWSGWTTTLDLWPETGRTHQLRIHCAHLGHPVLGDELYTDESMPLMRGGGLFLAAVAIELPHPQGGTVSAEVDEPAKFGKYRQRSERAAQAVEARAAAERSAEAAAD